MLSSRFIPRVHIRSFQWSQPLTIYHCGHGYVASLCSVSIVGRKALRLFEERLLESHFLCHLYFKIQLSQTHFDPAISISKFQIEISFSYLIFHLNLIFCIFANTLVSEDDFFGVAAGGWSEDPSRKKHKILPNSSPAVWRSAISIPTAAGGNAQHIHCSAFPST